MSTKTPEPAIRLYFVRADTPDGDNLDLFVRAASAKEAEEVWSKHYDCDHAERPMWAAAIPDTPARGAIPWSSIKQE